MPTNPWKERKMNAMTTDMAPVDVYGTLTGPMTLTIQRILPGPIERIWSYLTESEMRARWLAAGEMEPRVGGAAEFIWRNDELTDPPGTKPEGFGVEHRMKATVTEYDPPRRLAFTWDETGGVSILLEPKGVRVLLTRSRTATRHDARCFSASALAGTRISTCLRRGRRERHRRRSGTHGRG